MAFPRSDISGVNGHHSRWIALVAILLIMALLSGCAPVIPKDAESVPVYATFYPIYALADAVLRDVPNIELRCLVQPQDGCLRNYELSDWDLAQLSSAKAVLMGGRGLESFESALFALGEDGPAVAAALYNLNLYNPSTSHEGAGTSHIEGANPHLYMSLDGAEELLESLCAAMITMDPDCADYYTANLEAAREALNQLKGETREIVGNGTSHRVAIMNEALIYVARDFDLTVDEWIDRESGESMDNDALDACLARLEASGAAVVLIEKQAPDSLIQALEAAGYSVALIDILSTHREADGFETYLRVQRANAQALREAFDRAGTA